MRGDVPVRGDALFRGQMHTLRNSKKEREKMRASSKIMMSHRAKMTNPGYNLNMTGRDAAMFNS